MTNLLAMLFQDNSAPNPAANAAAMGFLIVYAVIILLMIATGWRIFTKAGEPGWAILVPIYNIIVLLKIVGKPAWWFILMIIPGVNLIVGIILTFELAKHFGKGTGFALGLLFLGPIFGPILAFGDAKYQPQAA